MVGNKKTNILKNEKGQALFELIIFLPFLIFMYMLYSTAGDSISASINQQKAVRGYFYSLLRGNSYVNNLLDLKEFSGKAVPMVGFSAIGWRERSEKGGQNAFGPCFEFKPILKNVSSEKCDDSAREKDSSGHGISNFVRVFTFYGVCGPVYSETKDVNAQSFFRIHPSTQSDPRKCALGKSPLN